MTGGSHDRMQTVTENLDVLRIYETTSKERLKEKLLTYITLEMNGVLKTKGEKNCTKLNSKLT